ncbi:MAG: AmmeMemoRadiSam system protein B [Candidatus Eutrophobiaceae bacterium]
MSKLIASHGTAAAEAPHSKAIIVPHAGYIYSGDAAARVYAMLSAHASKIERVVLLGPAHRVYTQGVATSSATYFASPIGNIPIDLQWQDRLQCLDFVHCSDEAHQQEHSLEVHLPFLQLALGKFKLIPLVVGDTSTEEVAKTLDCLWGGTETLLVVSTDLSHYHDYNNANRIDAETCRMISAFDHQSLSGERACGFHPMRGLLSQAAQRNMHIELLHRCNSGDTAGDKQRVVGYGAFALWEAEENDSALQQAKPRLLAVARRSIENGLAGKGECPVSLEEWEGELRGLRGVFVTLKCNGHLRGCVGHIDAKLPLPRAVAHLAHAAAFNDQRFSPLGADEYGQISVEISVLSSRRPLAFSSEQDLIGKLRPGEDGLVIALGHRQAVFLPAVWQELPNAEEFLSHLKEKAAIGQDESPTKAWRYTVEKLAE